MRKQKSNKLKAKVFDILFDLFTWAIIIGISFSVSLVCWKIIEKI